jgi:hypothetical protein
MDVGRISARKQDYPADLDSPYLVGVDGPRLASIGYALGPWLAAE